MQDVAFRVAVLTVSDKGARGERTDTSGPAIAEMVTLAGGLVRFAEVVPDEADRISTVLREWCDGGEVEVVLTTGGTGFSPRDRTPEATMSVIERPAPGIPEALRAAGTTRTPMAALSRGVAGIRGATLIVNLPGSERAVREGMELLLKMLPHAVEMLRAGGEHGAGGGDAG